MNGGAALSDRSGCRRRPAPTDRGARRCGFASQNHPKTHL